MNGAMLESGSDALTVSRSLEAFGVGRRLSEAVAQVVRQGRACLAALRADAINPEKADIGFAAAVAVLNALSIHGGDWLRVRPAPRSGARRCAARRTGFSRIQKPKAGPPHRRRRASPCPSRRPRRHRACEGGRTDLCSPCASRAVTTGLAPGARGTPVGGAAAVVTTGFSHSGGHGENDRRGGRGKDPSSPGSRDDGDGFRSLSGCAMRRSSGGALNCGLARAWGMGRSPGRADARPSGLARAWGMVEKFSDTPLTRRFPGRTMRAMLDFTPPPPPCSAPRIARN